MKYFIRATFSGWKEVTEQEQKNFIDFLRRECLCGKEEFKKVLKRHVRTEDG